MKKRIFVWALVAWTLLGGVSGAEDVLPEAYRHYLETAEAPAPPSLRQDSGFAGIACEPERFMQAVQGAAGALRPLDAMLADLGVPGDQMPEPGRWGVPERAEAPKYWDVPGLTGPATLSVVLSHMGGYRIAAVFLLEAAGWRLIDCLEMDDYGMENPSVPPLLLRDDGSPGAWLLVESMGHGTGYSMRYEHWYNVLAGQYDAGYVREGFDEFARDGTGFLYAVLLREMADVRGGIPAAVPFTTWISLVHWPITGDMLADDTQQERSAHLVTGRYVYDAQTAAYHREDGAILPAEAGQSPAMAFFQGNWR